MQIFMAWSGERSLQFAKCVTSWLRDLFRDQPVDLYLSAEAGPGRTWPEELMKALRNSQLAVLCLAQESLGSTWLHFETGWLLAKGEVTVIPFLLDDVRGGRLPLAGLNALSADSSGARALAEIVAQKLATEVRDFDNHWRTLEEALESVRTGSFRRRKGIAGLRKFESEIRVHRDNHLAVESAFRTIAARRSAHESEFANRAFPVFICGSAAIGKSTFASMLERRLNSCGVDALKATTLPTDAYSLLRTEKDRLQLQGYEPQSHRLDQLCADFSALTSETSAPVRVTPYNHRTGCFDPEREISPHSVLIVEGVYSFEPCERMSNVGGLRIYIDAVAPKAMELKFAADVMYRNSTVERAFTAMTKNYGTYERHIRSRYFQIDRGMLTIEVSSYWQYDLVRID